MKKVLDEFCELVKSSQFYEAHEVLEDVWFERRFEDNDEIRFLKGLINSAVSFELQKKGRMEASKKVWKNYLKYRQLFFRFNSTCKNEYYQTMRFIDNF